jgi:gliding motility-associated protein GldM
MSGILKFTGNSFLLATAVAFLFSCTNNSKNNITVFKALDESLVKSNYLLGISCENTCRVMEDKLNDPSTNYRATVWYPKAMQIQKLSQEAINYIEDLKTELKKEAGLTEEGIFKEDDVNIVNRFFSKNAKGEEFFTRLQKYKKDVLAIDDLIMNEFEKTITLTTKEYDVSKEGKTFTKTFLNEIPTVEGLTMLSKFQNNIRVIESRTILFCREQIPSSDRFYEYYNGIVSQNSSCVKTGEEIEITAGIGAFSSFPKPEIIIEGKNIPINDEGVAISKFKAIGKPGKHFIPVQISYIDQNGSKQTIAKTVEYTIAKE